MASNQTKNYGLNQWERTDKVLMEDFNEDNAKIEAALLAHDAVLAKKGNCRLALYTYTGTGTVGASGACSIRFSGGAPILILVLGGGSNDLWLHQRVSQIVINNSSSVIVNWSSSGVSWYSYSNAEFQLNSNGVTYTALMFYKLD